jgi:hypothetical protein
VSDKVLLTLQDLHVLAATAERNGTQRNFPDVALQWAAGAQAEIDRLRAELAEAIEREREACAKLIEAYPYWLGPAAKSEIAAAIRARSALQSPRT